MFWTASFVLLFLSASAAPEEQHEAFDKLVDDMMGSLVGAVVLKAQPLSGLQVNGPLRSLRSAQGQTLTPARGSAFLSIPATAIERAVHLMPVSNVRAGVVAHAKGDVFEIDQPKPLGLEFKQEGKDIVVTKVDKNADPRVNVGDKLLAVSASFGGEVWPALNYPQTMMSINTRIGNVYLKMESMGKKQMFGGRGKAKKLSKAEIEAQEAEDEAAEKRMGVNAIFQTIATIGGLGLIAFIAYITTTV